VISVQPLLLLKLMLILLLVQLLLLLLLLPWLLRLLLLALLLLLRLRLLLPALLLLLLLLLLLEWDPREATGEHRLSASALLCATAPNRGVPWALCRSNISPLPWEQPQCSGWRGQGRCCIRSSIPIASCNAVLSCLVRNYGTQVNSCLPKASILLSALQLLLCDALPGQLETLPY